MTRSERRKRRYNAVYNATGDVALSRRLRDRADDFIYRQYGIKIPKRVIPERKELTQKQINAKQRNLERFQYARSLGIEPDRAIRIRRYSKKNIQKEAQWYPRIKRVADPRGDRIEAWKDMARDQAYAPSLKIPARKINRLNGLDKNDSYGYTIVFYNYVEDGKVDPDRLMALMQDIKADQFTGGAIYPKVQRRR